MVNLILFIEMSWLLGNIFLFLDFGVFVLYLVKCSELILVYLE